METSLNLANSAKCAQLRLQPVTAGRLPKSLVLWPRPMQLSLSSLCSTILTPKRLFTTPMCPSPFKVRGQIGAHCVSIMVLDQRSFRAHLVSVTVLDQVPAELNAAGVKSLTVIILHSYPGPQKAHFCRVLASSRNRRWPCDSRLAARENVLMM